MVGRSDHEGIRLERRAHGHDTHSYAGASETAVRIGLGALVPNQLRPARGCRARGHLAVAFAPSPKFFATHAYTAAKSAVIGFTTTCAAYYAAHNIRFNVIGRSFKWGSKTGEMRM